MIFRHFRNSSQTLIKRNTKKEEQKILKERKKFRENIPQALIEQ